MPDLRRSARVLLMQPVSLRVTSNGNNPIHATTRDLSAGGVFLYADKEIAAGSPVEVDLEWPQEFCGSEPIQLRGWGRVVRVEPGCFPGTFGVGVAIAGYQQRTWIAQPRREVRQEAVAAETP
ncbi:MAG: PilZ domain-containing protein [Terriglobales bacterium]